MASDADQDFADKMQMLRDKYIVRLEDTRVALETAMARLSEGSATGDERADILPHTIHRSICEVGQRFVRTQQMGRRHAVAWAKLL